MRRWLSAWLLGVLTLPILGLGLAWLGMLPARASGPAPAWESALAQMALHNYVRRHAPQVTSPIAPTEENLVAGMKIFRDACAGCHGDVSVPSSYGASFRPNVPQFAQRSPRLPEYQLFWIIKHGVRYSGMSAWDRQWDNNELTSDRNIWTVALFLSRLDSLPPAVDAKWRATQP
jgi:mono/diheme cytochrome c family protein